MTDGDPSCRLRSFYDRNARLYDRVAIAPLVGRWRRRTVETLALDSGDTVVEMGCGTGANFPHLRGAVGPGGTVVGADFAHGALARASERVDGHGWQNVCLLAGDVTRPPVDGPVDAVVATFVVGTLTDPRVAVERWCDLLADGGRLAMLHAQRADGFPATVLNPLFDRLVARVNPGSDAGGADRLRRRVDAARETLAGRADAVRRETLAAGFLDCTTARIG